jgi:hypothetical protein
MGSSFSVGSNVRLLLSLVAFALLATPVCAQTAPPPPAGSFENVTIGEPMADLHSTLGDPLRIIPSSSFDIWRYMAHGNGIYIDVLVKDNVAQSVTVLRRIERATYVDPRGAAFGMTPEQLRAKLGPTTRESTNADDGSLDLWYVAQPYLWIYEFHAGKLDFIQLVASPALRQTFEPAPPTVANDGSSLERAIWIRPSNFLTNSFWIDAFLAANACGNGGHWKEASLKLVADDAKRDPLAYTIVHAACTDGTSQRDFYFDTHGTAKANGNQTTIYIDTNALPAIAEPSPSPLPR